MLRAVGGAALAALFLVSIMACSSTGRRTAGAVALTATAPATTTLRPTPTILPATPLNLGCCHNVQPASSVIGSGTAKKSVALTFDAGPSPDYTHVMLDTLEQMHTPATFFVVGSNVQKYPALVRREAGDGYALGLHTWDHPFMTKLSSEQRAWE